MDQGLALRRIVD
ncbi:unnamed protein product, partial [Allacma fusca]